MHVELRNMRVAAADGSALEQAAADTTATRAFQHRDTELSRTLVAFSGQIGQMADANQVQRFIENAENGIARKVDIRDVVLDHAIRHDLAEAQQTVVFVKRQKVGHQALAIYGRQLTHENRRTTGSRWQAIG